MSNSEGGNVSKHEWRRDERTGKQRRVKVESAPPPEDTVIEDAPAAPTPPTLNPAVEAALNTMGRAWVLVVGGEGDAATRARTVYWRDALTPHGVTDLAMDAATTARDAERAYLAQVYAVIAQATDTGTDGTDGVPAETSEGQLPPPEGEDL